MKGRQFGAPAFPAPPMHAELLWLGAWYVCGVHATKRDGVHAAAPGLILRLYEVYRIYDMKGFGFWVLGFKASNLEILQRYHTIKVVPEIKKLPKALKLRQKIPESINLPKISILTYPIKC